MNLQLQMSSWEGVEGCLHLECVNGVIALAELHDIFCYLGLGLRPNPELKEDVGLAARTR